MMACNHLCSRNRDLSVPKQLYFKQASTIKALKRTGIDRTSVCLCVELHDEIRGKVEQSDLKNVARCQARVLSKGVDFNPLIMSQWEACQRFGTARWKTRWHKCACQRYG